MIPGLAPPGERTLHAVLERNAAVLGDRPFLIDDAGVLSWGQAWERARAVAKGLRAAGVRRGDRVAIVLDNSREFVETWFGLSLIAAIEVPVAPGAGVRRLHWMLANSGARVAVVEPRLLSELGSLPETVERLVVVGAQAPGGESSRVMPYAALTSADESTPSLADTCAADPVAIMYTSGSTGPPKGVVLPHGQHFTNGKQAAGAVGIGIDDVIFLCLPLYHNMAQGYGIWPALFAGATVHLVRRFESGVFWEQVTESKATVLPFVGDLIAILAKAKPSPSESSHALRVGYGVPIPAALHKDFERRFGFELIHAYGSTEATIPVWSVGPRRVIGSAGRVVDGFDVEIRGPEGTVLPAGAVGEIFVRAREPNMIFSGYYRDPERTARVLRDGWFQTGDNGTFDEQGNLWFRGRRGDVIRHHGEFVAAAEVESAAIEHPDVVLAAAFGVPSELADDDIMLAVAIRPDSALTAGKLRTWLSTRLPQFAVPRYLDLAASLPVTPTGKVDKQRLRARGVTETTDDARTAKEKT